MYACARFQLPPRESHLIVVKRIFRYLVGTKNFGLWFPKGGDFSLVGYSDADYAGYKVDRKSTLATCNLLVHHLFLGTLRSKTQWQFQQQKQSTLPLEHVLRNPYG